MKFYQHHKKYMEDKKVLLYISRDETDSLMMQPTNYELLWERYKIWGGNSGNKMFLCALEKYLKSANVYLEYVYYNHLKGNFWDNTITIEEVNERYDMIFFPQANIFSDNQMACTFMEEWSKIIAQIRIPVYCIGVGVQLDCYCKIDELKNKIKHTVVNFANAILNTGGTITLRGYITAEFLSKCGFNDLPILGCPSAYQNGGNIHVCEKKVDKGCFKPSINGNISILKDPKFSKLIHAESDIIYIDQDEFIDLLFLKKRQEKKCRVIDIFRMIEKYSYIGTKLFAKNKIRLFYDLPIWFDFLKKQNINFSFGGRIHGNLVAIINNIPALVYCTDMRTLELCDFFDIPYLTKLNTKQTLYDLYCETNYKKFNQRYKDRFHEFADFFKKIGIESEVLNGKMNIDNELGLYQYPPQYNEKFAEKVKQGLELNNRLFDVYICSKNIKNFLRKDKR